jgi:DUF1009 family protein
MSPPTDKPLGILAGGGRLPLLAARAVAARGRPVVAVQFAETGQRGLARQLPQGAATFSLGLVGAMLEHFRAHGVEDLLFLGKVEKGLNFADIRFDDVGLAMLQRLPGRADGAIFAVVAEELEARGFHIASQAAELAEWLAPEGHLAGPALHSSRAADVARGFEVAAALAAYDVGQTVAIKNGVVVAVEAFEHTDACLRRAGRLAGKGLVVCKTARPKQDPRFDVPAVGPDTLKTLGRLAAAGLAIEAGRTFWLEQEKCRELAAQFGVSVIGGRRR